MYKEKRNGSNYNTRREIEEKVNNSLKGLQEQREIRSSIRSSSSSIIFNGLK